ncbi:hypothetical protein [Paraburkholderia sp. CI3]|uniref:hypothetical protein n=1 Tax=Paraburkholderia sp. CI3 TaxID=2991060 RepID=UPI003D252DFE
MSRGQRLAGIVDNELAKFARWIISDASGQSGIRRATTKADDDVDALTEEIHNRKVQDTSATIRPGATEQIEIPATADLGDLESKTGDGASKQSDAQI